MREVAYRGSNPLTTLNFKRKFQGKGEETCTIKSVKLTLNAIDIDGLIEGREEIKQDYFKLFEFSGLRSSITSNYITPGKKKLF